MWSEVYGPKNSCLNRTIIGLKFAQSFSNVHPSQSFESNYYRIEITLEKEFEVRRAWFESNYYRIEILHFAHT